MDLTSPTTIKNILSRHQAKPTKIMGQNFLVDASVLNKIIQAAELQPEDIVLEIGPGIGTLTQELAKKTKKVIAIEKDRVMVEILKETLKDYKNVEIIQGNILTADYKLPAHYKLVANLPYYITSPIIRMFLEAKNPPEHMVLMVQKEVGQRICAKPPNMSILSVSVQIYALPNIISTVSKGSFWPSPKVDSAIIKIQPQNTIAKNIDTDIFFKIVKAGFLHPRKQLANNLSVGLKKTKEQINPWLLKNNINPLQRAETLSIQDWITLTQSYSHLKPNA